MVMSVQKQAQAAKFTQRTIKPSSLVLALSAVSACGFGDSDNSNDNSTQDGGDQAPTTTVTGSNDGLSGTPRSVNLTVNNANDTDAGGGDIDELNIVFGVNASFDAKQLADGSVINLGLDAAGQKIASLGTVDFDEVSGPLAVLNVHAGAPHVEVDHIKDNQGTLVINFENDAEARIGVAEFDPSTIINFFNDIRPLKDVSMDVLDAETIEINHLSASPAFIEGSITIDHYTTKMSFTTSQVGGDLDVGWHGRVAAVEEGSALREVIVDGDYGNVRIATPLTFHGDGGFVDNADSLQHYSVSGDNNAYLSLGSVGYLALADDLETITVNMKNGASLAQAAIFSPNGSVSELSITSSNSSNVAPRNEFSATFLQLNTYTDDYSVVMRNLWLGELSHLHIDTSAGGSVLLMQSNFIAHDQVFVGSGNITIEAEFELVTFTTSLLDPGNAPDFTPFQQLKPADASGHTGERFFVDGQGHDIFYGSDQADTIFFTYQNGVHALGVMPIQYSGEYRDAGGDDLIIVGRIGLPALIIDGDAGTNDIVRSEPDGFALIFEHRLEFQAGSGNDLVEFTGAVGEPTLIPSYPVPNNNVFIDLGTWINGHVQVDNFLGNSAYFSISLDGLPGITNTNVDYFMALDPASPILIDENSVYVLEDGDPSGNRLISDYGDLSSVSSALNQMFVGTMQDGDSAVFVIHDVNSAAGESDYYFYLYTEQGDGTMINTSDLQHFATFDLAPATSATAVEELTPLSFV